MIRSSMLALSLLLASAGCTKPEDDDTAGDDDDSAPDDDDTASDDDDDTSTDDDDTSSDDDDTSTDDDDTSTDDDDTSTDDDDSAFDPTIPLCDPLANVGVITIGNDLSMAVVDAQIADSRMMSWVSALSAPVASGGTLTIPFDGCSAYVDVDLDDGSERFYWFRPSAITPAITLSLSSLRDTTAARCTMSLSSDIIYAPVLDIELHVEGGPQVLPLMGDDGLPLLPYWDPEAYIIHVDAPIPMGSHDMSSDQNPFIECGSWGSIPIQCPSPFSRAAGFNEELCR